MQKKGAPSIHVSQLASQAPSWTEAKRTLCSPFPRCWVLLMKARMWSPALSLQQCLRRRVGLPPPLGRCSLGSASGERGTVVKQAAVNHDFRLVLSKQMHAGSNLWTEITSIITFSHIIHVFNLVTFYILLFSLLSVILSNRIHFPWSCLNNMFETNVCG